MYHYHYFDFIYSPDVYTVCNCLQYLSDFLNLKSNKGHLRLNWSDTERLAKELDGMETELNFFYGVCFSENSKHFFVYFYFSFARLLCKFTSTTRIKYFHSQYLNARIVFILIIIIRSTIYGQIFLSSSINGTPSKQKFLCDGIWQPASNFWQHRFFLYCQMPTDSTTSFKM